MGPGEHPIHTGGHREPIPSGATPAAEEHSQSIDLTKEILPRPNQDSPQQTDPKPRRAPRKQRSTADTANQPSHIDDAERERKISSHIHETCSSRSRWQDYKRSTIEMLRISPATWAGRIGLTALSAVGVSTFTYCMSQGIVALGDAATMMQSTSHAASEPHDLLAPIGQALTWLVGGALAFQAGRLFSSINDTVSDTHTLEVDLKIERSLGTATESLLEETRQREDVAELLTLADDHQASSKELVNGIVHLSQELVEFAISVGVLLWSGAGPTTIPIALGGYLTYRSARRCSSREVTAEQEVNKLYQLYEDGHRALTTNTSISNLQQMHAYGRVFEQVLEIKAKAEVIRNDARRANRTDDLLTDTMLWVPVLGSAAVASAYFWQGAYDGATLIWIWMTLYPLQDRISSIGTLISAQATDLELTSSRHALNDIASTIGDTREKIPLSDPVSVTFEKVRLRRRGSSRDTLKETSFSIAPGMSVAIVGNNGQGKSSLLGLISGRLLPSSGDVFIGPHNTREKSVLIGNLSQDFTLVAGRSVRDNIELYRSRGHGLSAEQVVERLGIGEVLFDNKPEGLETILPGINQKGTNFSGGQRQLIALAQAIASEPGLLVFDEPLSALGPSMQSHINNVLLNLEKRPTIFFVTHKYEQANSCDWVIVIEKGEIVEQGAPQDLLNKRRGSYRSLYHQQRKLVSRRAGRRTTPPSASATPPVHKKEESPDRASSGQQTDLAE